MHAQHGFITAVTAAGCLALILSGADQKLVKKEFPSIAAANGAEMYKAYCASCHGAEGKGDGPAAPALKTAATDLTLLTRNNNGIFPALAVLNTLRPGGGVHGSEDMPVWGDIFRQSGQDHVTIHFRTYNLMRYLEEIQAPAPPPVKREPAPRALRVTDVRPQFGGDMYRAYCASCHGADGRGAGPSAYTLKKVPTDLTRLTGPDGKFPNLRIQQILSEVGTPAHGSKDMPVWGQVFRSSFDDPPVTTLRIHNLTRYLESIQQR